MVVAHPDAGVDAALLAWLISSRMTLVVER